MGDSTIRAVLIYRITQLFTHGLTTLMVSLSLESQELGIYYLFVSMLTAQVLFELGLNHAALQISSHILNKESNKFRNFIFWLDGLYVRIATRYFLIGGGVGCAYLVLFNEFDAERVLIYWIILIASSSYLMRISYRFSMIESEGNVVYSYLSRAIILFCSSIVAWLLIYLDFGLESLFALYLMQAIMANLFLKQAFVVKQDIKTNKKLNEYCLELIKFQKKLGLSYLAGYLSYNLIVPIVFAFISAKVAGQLGLTLAIFSAATLLSTSFASSKNHAFVISLSNKDYFGLNKIFKRQLFLTVVLGFLMLISIYFLILGIGFIGFDFASRILPPVLCSLIGLSSVASSVIYTMALYVRAHKEEPFVNISIFTGITSALLILAGSFFGINWVVFLYTASIIFISMPLTVLIFLKFFNKNEKLYADNIYSNL